MTGHSEEKVDRTGIPPTQRGPRNVHSSSTGFGRKTSSPKQIPRQQINHEIYRNDSFIYYFNLQRSDSGRAIKGEIKLREGLAINGAPMIKYETHGIRFARALLFYLRKVRPEK